MKHAFATEDVNQFFATEYVNQFFPQNEVNVYPGVPVCNTQYLWSTHNSPEAITVTIILSDRLYIQGIYTRLQKINNL